MINLKLRKFILGAAAMLLFTLILPSASITSYASPVNDITDEGSGPLITTYKALIEYRYKIENNKLYRRLYNYSTQQWESEWEWCP